MLEWKEVTPEKSIFKKQINVIRKDFGIVIGMLTLDIQDTWVWTLKGIDFNFLGKITEEEARKEFQKVIDKYI